ncbi:MAG: N-acetylmuramoyl-L-alanine amidase [candidate division KSB1 bacterium]|nr:N-acetylmuramoyl-L-alanine amidase [candidate division KSB1 bacterium]MDZ7274996.1 N-acetylmuramoyl-L-alanine amidase [candidate division KSB1 bacterium]MDZ7286554.1 N-acetylmuramoyl-L-alanine amidase [candidate division KSB1 bacterium]MDZ7299282.1 N-acetylmuramoyl-L-alanine amidase [candidate division KSB1 bacterium]MDZ7306058.1 N-acetylmuramoyl-L-alanine amidase [candidate division KSB1 bacterium]
MSKLDRFLWWWLAVFCLLGMSSAPMRAAETRSLQIIHTAGDFRAGGQQPGLQLTRLVLMLSPDARHATYVSPPIASPFPFNAIGPHWLAAIPAGAALQVAVRVSADGEHWGDWLPVPAEEEVIAAVTEDGRPNPFAGDQPGALVFVDPRSRWVQYRLTLSGNTPQVERMCLQLINSMEGPTIPDRGQPEEGAVSPAKPGSVPKPRIYKRAEWGARPPSMAYQYTTAKHLGFHHTAGVSDFTVGSYTDCAARVRAIQAYHMDTNGWIDIGYNYTICKHGHIFQAREDDNDATDVRGAHDGYNAGSMGVSALGYFHPPYNHQPTPELMHALHSLLAWKCDERGIDPKGASLYAAYGAVRDHIYGHREVGATACPGDILFARKAAIRDSVAYIIGQFATSVAESPAPASYQLLQCHPNPYAPAGGAAAMMIRIFLPNAEVATLAVYNLLGRRVRLLHDHLLPAGQNLWRWNGRDDEGRLQPAGVYLVRLHTATQTRQTKILLVK